MDIKTGKPLRISVNGEIYHASVFLVDTELLNGTPRICTLIPDDKPIELFGGEKFMIAYVPESMLHG